MENALRNDDGYGNDNAKKHEKAVILVKRTKMIVLHVRHAFLKTRQNTTTWNDQI